MTSGRSLPRKGADWSRASGRYKETVRTMMTARVWTPSGPVRTYGLHLRPDSKGETSRPLVRPESKGETSRPLVRPDVNVDRLDAPH